MKKVLAGASTCVVAVMAGVIIWRNLDDPGYSPIGDTVAKGSTTAASAPAKSSPPAANKKSMNVDMPPAAATPPRPAATFQESVALAEATRQVRAAPEAVEVARVARTGVAHLKYPDLGEAFDLSPEDESRLYDLLTRQGNDEMRAITSREMSYEAFGQRQKANEAEIASMLGDKFHRWKEYTLEIPSRYELRDLRAVLETSGSPLDDAQSGPLLRALVAAQQLIYRENDGPGHSPGNIRRYLDAASPHLTPHQMEAYQKMMERKGNLGQVAP